MRSKYHCHLPRLRPRNMHMPSLRHAVLLPLCETDPLQKAAQVLALPTDLPTASAQAIALPPGIPGRPAGVRPVLATELKKLPLRTLPGRAALIHSVVHIELNAIDLALDIICRFADLPDAFYRDWLVIAKEEAQHFLLLRNHLRTCGYEYGDFEVHNGLWDMAEKTRTDILARVALVPRTLEARGLDASPQVKKKLVGAGDVRGGEILDIILRDEIGHVAAGNRWYRWLCTQRGLDPIATYTELVRHYAPPPLRQPFNLPARRLAGFEEIELEHLLALTGKGVC